MGKVLFGIDYLLLQKNKFQHLRLALLTNNAATTSNGESSRVALLKAGFPIVKLFSPEHGLTAKGEDGAYQSNSIDSLTQLPIISLYGDHLMPTEEDLADIDIVFFDIPDAGCRFYTYLWTMTYVMEACALHNKPLVILDRPNPIGGDINKAEGPMLDEINCSAFIGRWNIPVRHSCTLGELATYFVATRVKDLHLDVIKVQHWNRKQTASEAGWYFVPTSPAIPDVETALLYPGLGLFEGITVNEGRGTDSSFKIIGTPWIDAQQLNEAFIDLQLPGIRSDVINYVPAWGMYANENCTGLQFSLTDSNNFRPVETGLRLLHLIASLYPAKAKERLYPTVANPSGEGHLDKLSGVHHAFEKIQKGELLSSKLQPDDWKEKIQPYLLY
ncbi:MAG: DUF1343 domain-containing protein [Bacteroidota bacterium]|nr:DUF1343 domain-containing protein [Bacteroidota bacterium]